MFWLVWNLWLLHHSLCSNSSISVLAFKGKSPINKVTRNVLNICKNQNDLTFLGLDHNPLFFRCVQLILFQHLNMGMVSSMRWHRWSSASTTDVRNLLVTSQSPNLWYTEWAPKYHWVGSSLRSQGSCRNRSEPHVGKMLPLLLFRNPWCATARKQTTTTNYLLS